jgi:hypothetical protein
LNQDDEMQWFQQVGQFENDIEIGNYELMEIYNEEVNYELQNSFC